MIYGILVIILGILAVPSLILAKKPNAKEIFDKIAPYQGWIGIVAILLGIWDVIHLIQSLSLLGSGVLGIIVWIVILLMAVVELSLGFIMGYGILDKYIFSKKSQPKEGEQAPEGEAKSNKGQEVLAKLAPYQGKLGLLAIGTGIVYIILYIYLSS